MSHDCCWPARGSTSGVRRAARRCSGCQPRAEPLHRRPKRGGGPSRRCRRQHIMERWGGRCKRVSAPRCRRRRGSVRAAKDAHHGMTGRRAAGGAAAHPPRSQSKVQTRVYNARLWGGVRPSCARKPARTAGSSRVAPPRRQSTGWASSCPQLFTPAGPPARLAPPPPLLVPLPCERPWYHPPRRRAAGAPQSSWMRASVMTRSSSSSCFIFCPVERRSSAAVSGSAATDARRSFHASAVCATASCASLKSSSVETKKERRQVGGAR